MSLGGVMQGDSNILIKMKLGRASTLATQRCDKHWGWGLGVGAGAGAEGEERTRRYEAYSQLEESVRERASRSEVR